MVDRIDIIINARAEQARKEFQKLSENMKETADKTKLLNEGAKRTGLTTKHPS